MITKDDQETPMNQRAYDPSSGTAAGPASSNVAIPADPTVTVSKSVERPAPIPSVPGAKYARMLNRSEAALALGISKSEFCRREALQIYRATVIDEKGWHLFAIEYVSTLPGYGLDRREVKRSTKVEKVTKMRQELSNRPQISGGSGGSCYDPEVASLVFRELNAGLSSCDIVMKLLIHPDVMTTIYDAWKRLLLQDGGGIVVSAKQMEIINELPLPGSFPILTGDQLVVNLRKASQGTAMCPVCKIRACQICIICAEPEPEQSPAPAAKKSAGASAISQNRRVR